VDRALNFAVVSSLALHAALLFGVSMQREGAKRDAAPLPLEARLVEPLPPPAPPPAPPQAEPVKPKPPPAPARLAKRKPAPAPKPVPESLREPPPPPPPSAPIAQPAPPAPPSVAKVEPRPAPAAPSAQQLEALTREQYRLALIDIARGDNRYPPVARENNWEGTVLVRMVIGVDARVNLSVKQSSGHPVLDRQALEMFKRAQAKVPLPPSLRGKEVTLELRAVYHLKDQVSG